MQIEDLELENNRLNKEVRDINSKFTSENERLNTQNHDLNQELLSQKQETISQKQDLRESEKERRNLEKKVNEHIKKISNLERLLNLKSSEHDSHVLDFQNEVFTRDSISHIIKLLIESMFDNKNSGW